MASKRIAGITIEIDGNVTGLNKALKSVDEQLGKTKFALKDVNKLLKLDPKNTELLRQKQKLLQDAIKTTKERLAKLKEAQSQATKPDEWDALQREIVATEEDLQGLEKEFGTLETTAAEKLKSVGEKLQGVGDKMEGAGKTLSKTVTAPILGVAGAAVKTTMDFDAQMSKVGAISGAQGEDFDALRAKAREMGATTKFSATEAAEAMEYMGMAGWKTQEMLDGIPGIMNLAAASGEDLGTTSDIVTDALTAFGKGAEYAGDFADVLAVASTNANTNVSMMGESFKYSAAMAGGMGYNYRDVAIALGLMANSGVKSGQAGRALRNVMQRIAKPTEESTQAIKYFNLSTTNADGSQKSLREVMQSLRETAKKQPEAFDAAADAALKLSQQFEDGEISEEEYNDGMLDISTGANEFMGNIARLAGAQGLPGLLAIMKSSDEEFNSLADAIDNSGGAAEQMSERMLDNLQGQLTILKSQLQEAAISIGDILTPVIRDLTSLVQGLVDKFNNLTPQQKEMIVRIAEIVAAVGPALVIGGKVTKTVGKIADGIGDAITAVKGVSAVVQGGGGLMGALKAVATMIGPGGLVLAGIAAVVAAGVALYLNWDKIKAKAKQLKEFLKKTWENIKKTAEKIWKNITTAISNAWTAIKTTVSGAIENVKTTVSGAWTKIKSGVSGAWNNIKTAVSTGVNAVKTAVSTKFTQIKDAVKGAWEKVKSGATTAWTNIKSAVSTGVSAVKSAISGKFTQIKSGLASSWNNIKSKAVSTWNSIKSSVAGVAEKLKSSLTSKFTAAGSSIISKFNSVKSTVTSTVSSIASSVKTKFSKLKENIASAFSKIKVSDPFGELRRAAEGVIKTIKGLFNIKLSFPKFTLPHFSVSGKFSLNPPQVPKLDVKWYKKAYDNPFLFTKPTVLQTPAGAKGFGDGSGAEMVYGHRQLMRDIAAAKGGEVTINVYASEGMDVNALADKISDRFVALQRQQERVWA